MAEQTQLPSIQELKKFLSRFRTMAGAKDEVLRQLMDKYLDVEPSDPEYRAKAGVIMDESDRIKALDLREFKLELIKDHFQLDDLNDDQVEELDSMLSEVQHEKDKERAERHFRVSEKKPSIRLK